jgi:hypothetical protein
MLDFAAVFAFCDLHASRLRPVDRLGLLGGWSILYYDRQGFPLPSDPARGLEPTLVWAELHANPDYRIVAWDKLPDGSWLSTVWLGLDHGIGRPLFFETMRFTAARDERLVGSTLAFPDPTDGEDTTQLRYGSEEEALAAHHEILRRLRMRLGH